MLFKNIFDLDPKEVEDFIIELTKKNFRFDNAKEEEQFWNDFYLVVRWYPANNQFYVYTEPNLTYEYKNARFDKRAVEQFPCLKEIYAHFTFKGRETSLDEYLHHQSNHYHYNFREIYALMTGETEIWRVGYGSEDDIELYYNGIYKKNYIDVIKTKTNEWFLQEWEDSDDEKEDLKEIRKPLPEDLLKYVLELEPEEVEKR